MSETMDYSTWPPKDLIADLAINTNPDPEEELDENVAKVLPEGSEVLSITTSGSSAWVQTVRIDVRLAGGQEKAYFKKNQSGPNGRRMMEGTYESEIAFHKYIPDNVPRPIAWGSYSSDPDMYFYLAEYHDMIDETPDPAQFVDVVAKFHRESMGKAPDGKFGFHVPTHLANIPNDNGWEDTWEAFYTKAMRRMFELEVVSHGDNDAEFEELKDKMLTKVIPRLLRPMESGGRTLTPCLVHSDLWLGNCMPDADTDTIMFFDSCAFWGHNEADLGSWRAQRYRMGKPFLREYQRRMGICYPEEDWDDRNALYAMRYDMLVSSLFPNSEKFRELARQEMKRLTEKYPHGFDDFEEDKENWVAKR